MRASRVARIPGIGVDHVGDRADALADPDMLRLENLDTDLRPPAVAIETTRAAIDRDTANSYLPFQGSRALRAAAAAHVGRAAGRDYDPDSECVISAGGLNGVLNVLLACVEPGREVVVADPIYAGLINRIHLAGGVPRHVPMSPGPDGWSVDPQALADAVGPDTAAVLTMSPAMPTGAVLGREHWLALAAALERTDAVVVHDGAMERIRFDAGPSVHPAAIPGLSERTVTVGSASKELRMIGWRVGWVVGPAPLIRDVDLVGLSNVVCQVGIAQDAVAAALTHPDADRDVAAAVAEWKRRHDHIVTALHGLPVVPAHGGWSLLVGTRALGLDGVTAAQRLFDIGRVAATPMSGWGPSGEDHVRLVFANEPVERLGDLRDRVDAAWVR